MILMLISSRGFWPPDDKNIQSSLLKDLIGEKSAGVIIAPSFYPGIGNVLKQLSDFGSVIGVGPVKQEEGQLPTVMSDNFEIGTLAADALGQWADEKEGNVAWIGFEDSQGVQSERKKGFVQELNKQYPKLKITGIGGLNSPEAAYIATKQFISTSTEIKGIFAASDEATLGAARAIEELKQSGKISFVGVGSGKELENLLDQQVISSLIVPDAYQIGYEAVRLTVARFNGKTVPDISKVALTLLLSTRQFIQPQDFPPLTTAAYGIVAFPQGGTRDQKDRMKNICEAYYQTFPRASEVSTPIAQQMVTVWPVDSPQSLIQISKKTGNVETCESAVEHYGLTTSLKAIKEAESTTRGISLTGSGPFLLGWAPSSEKGKKDTLVLVVDLSGATTGDQYLGYFRQWRSDIERNPAVWNNGWTLDKFRLAIRDWADKTGTMLLPHGLVMKD
jgi:ABC-type sugar transport system substrate-binding protein